MIATKRGSSITAYAFPIFTWTTDDQQQVSRGAFKFQAGAFQLNPQNTYHIRNVLLTRCVSGMDMTFAEGGMEGSLQRDRDSKNDSVTAGSIVVVLEPWRDESKMPALITAYGSWAKMGYDSRVVAESNVPHFGGSDFMRKWWGIDRSRAVARNEVQAAYSVSSQPERLAMWRGTARHFNPASETANPITGSGPLSPNWWYREGMFTAINEGKAFAPSASMQVQVS
jgi:hypothetical protein